MTPSESELPQPTEGLPVPTSRESAEPVLPPRLPVTAGPANTGWQADLPATPRTAPPSGLALLQALRQRWLLAGTLGLLLAAAAGTAMWYLRPAKYTAFTLLRVASVEPALVRDPHSRPSSDYEVYQRTQIVLIKSPPVLAAALKQEKVRELPQVWDRTDPVGWLGDQIRAYFVDGTEILRIEMSGQDPVLLATLVNAVKHAYLEEAVKAERNQRLARLYELDSAYRARAEEVRKQQEYLRKLAESMQVPDPKGGGIQQQILLEEFSALRKELSLLDSELRKAQEKLAVRKARLQSGEIPVSELSVDEYLDSDPRVKQQSEQVRRVEIQIEDYKRTVPPNAPNSNLPKLRAELEYAVRTRDRLRSELRPGALEQLRKKLRTENQAVIDELDEQIEVLSRYQEGMRTQVNVQRKDVERMGKYSFELDMRRKEIEQADTVISTLRAEKERLQVEAQSAAQRVTELLSAEPPERKDTAAQLRAVIMASIGAFLLGALGVAFAEWRTRRISTADAVVNDLGMRVLGTMPSLTGRLRPSAGALDADAYWRGVLSESVDGLRAILTTGDAGAGVKQVLMVTSARDSEGKTMLATFLASSLARAGRRTLLIDCDLRRPTIHELLALPPGPGFSEVLCGRADLEEAIQLEPVTGLAVLPAGHRDREIFQTLARQGVRGLFDRLRVGFDFIIVDSCPVLPVADSLLIAPHADGVLLSIRFPVSRVPEVYAACERLRAVKARILGTVVQGTPGEFHSYRYSYLVQSPPVG